ncbi:hypothetical protein GCM10022234_29740 [Aeromicrobium panaciterrae]|uniref:hypothetical protein n=1 Tax=Aeromicrobium panaciterrae TaxID=363861 RepID=UPI0031D8A436
MNEDRGLPPYPPEHNAWEYPPPPISRRWIWAPILAVTLATVIGAGLVVGAVVIGSKDFPSVIQDDKILSVITRECDIMTETVKSMPIEGTAEEQASTIRDQDKAILNMLAAIRGVDEDVRAADPPTNDWLDDWNALVAAREAFAEQRSSGYELDLRIPKDADGDGIYQRMDEVWLTKEACEVPEELLNPYPEDISAA